jgi:hypothetical protein
MSQDPSRSRSRKRCTAHADVRALPRFGPMTKFWALPYVGQRGRAQLPKNDPGKREDPAACYPDFPIAYCPFEFVARFLDLRDGSVDRLVTGEPSPVEFLQAGIQCISRVPGGPDRVELVRMRGEHRIDEGVLHQLDARSPAPRDHGSGTTRDHAREGGQERARSGMRFAASGVPQPVTGSQPGPAL